MEVGILKRIGAFIFDLLVINLVIAFPFQKMFINITPSAGNISPSLYYVVTIIALLALCYFAFFEYYLEQTIGMMLFNIKSIAENGDMKLWQAFARNLYIIPLFPFYFLWIVDPLYVIFKKERLTEKISSTKTVNVKTNIYKEYKLKKV